MIKCVVAKARAMLFLECTIFRFGARCDMLALLPMYMYIYLVLIGQESSHHAWIFLI